MLEQKVSDDMKQAMKDRQPEKVSTLRFLMADLKKVRIDKMVQKLDDAEVISIIKKQIKQRQESIAQFEQGGRDDLKNKEVAEIEILQTYLPSELSEDEIKKLIEAVMTETGATSIKEMGRVMKEVVARTAGRADNKKVSDLVKARLG